jgi:hypothetical protein
MKLTIFTVYGNCAMIDTIVKYVKILFCSVTFVINICLTLNCSPNK